MARRSFIVLESGASENISTRVSFLTISSLGLVEPAEFIRSVMSVSASARSSNQSGRLVATKKK